MTGRTLVHYRILAKLGEGGMGVVYRARDEQLERDVAIKVLPAASIGDATARARLLREARAAAALNHPHICTVYEVAEAEGQLYIAMELVEGQALSAKLERGGLPAAEVLRYGLQLASAVEHAHERGIVHRDFKSANVIISSDARAKVLDFGLAKKMGGEELAEAVTRSQETLTVFGALIGTVPYMAPEQLLAKTVDARSDVWALGVVLYEMAAGQRPFQGRTGFELSSAILNQPPPPLPLDAGVALRGVVERCLEKEPARRYQRGGEARAALEAVQSGVSLAPAPQPKPKRRFRVALAVAVALAAVLVTLVFIRPRPGARRLESLAVLPLENLSGDAAQEYFADGMTEALITDLGRLKGLQRVIARGSVMRFKGSKKSLKEIAQELQVEALITGAVLRSGDRVRITAQLIGASDEQQLWAEGYERDLRDILSLQSEVTRAIANEIKLKLTAEEQTRLASARQVNPEAYQAYLQGTFQWQKLTPESNQKAIKYFQEALQKDPTYALAYAGITTATLGPSHMGFVPPRDVFPKAKDAALKAIQLDNTLAETHAALGSVLLLYDWDWAAAGKEMERAVQINPRYPNTYQTYFDWLLLVGRRRQAEAMIPLCSQFDPLNAWVQAACGGRLLRLGRYDEGIALIEKALTSEPNMGLAHRYLWAGLHQQGKYERALVEAKTYFRVAGHTEAVEAMARGKSYPEAMKLGAERLVEKSKRTYVQPSEVARLFAYAGDKDRAFAWLDRAYEVRDTWLVWLKDDPRFTSLHSDPRFHALLRKMNIPEQEIP